MESPNAVKYVLLVLRADNDGEGGILSLKASLDLDQVSYFVERFLATPADGTAQMSGTSSTITKTHHNRGRRAGPLVCGRGTLDLTSGRGPRSRREPTGSIGCHQTPL